MYDTRRKGSGAPMWWGIFVVLAFTAAAAINYNLSEPAQATVVAESFRLR